MSVVAALVRLGPSKYENARPTTTTVLAREVFRAGTENEAFRSLLAKIYDGVTSRIRFENYARIVHRDSLMQPTGYELQMWRSGPKRLEILSSETWRDDDGKAVLGDDENYDALQHDSILEVLAVLRRDGTLEARVGVERMILGMSKMHSYWEIDLTSFDASKYRDHSFELRIEGVYTYWYDGEKEGEVTYGEDDRDIAIEEGYNRKSISREISEPWYEREHYDEDDEMDVELDDAAELQGDETPPLFPDPSSSHWPFS